MRVTGLPPRFSGTLTITQAAHQHAQLSHDLVTLQQKIKDLVSNDIRVTFHYDEEDVHAGEPLDKKFEAYIYKKDDPSQLPAATLSTRRGMMDIRHNPGLREEFFNEILIAALALGNGKTPQIPAKFRA